MDNETLLVLTLGPLGVGAITASIVRVVQMKRHQADDELLRDTRLRDAAADEQRRQGDKDAPSGSP